MMYCSYQVRQMLEDDLYHRDGEESEASEATSELEFHLYSQLHYSSNTVELEVQDGEDHPSQIGDLEIDAADKSTETAVNVELKDSPKNRPRSSNTLELQQRCNYKSDKGVKQKKGNSVPKVQRPWPKFAEVIVIGSSPEVITISESHSSSSSDDEGVCALKGGRVNRMLTSTLAQKTSHKKANYITQVSLDSSSSESDLESEFKSDSELSLSSNYSNSDVVENWMILGQGKQDGDQCISLNLEGGTDSNAEVEEDNVDSWVVSEKDQEAQIFNKDRNRQARTFISRVVHRYYTDKNVQCRNCDKTGHLSKNCPEPKTLPVCFLCGNPYHKSTKCPHKRCNNCGLPGHLHFSCNEMPYYHKRCHRCGMKGHFFDACPEIWRQYHLSTKKGPPLRQPRQDNGRSTAYCYNCSKKGHFGHGCTQQRMFRGPYAASPFINYYDTLKDIQHRQYRLKSKVEELKSIGLMPDNSQTWLTVGSQNKKQKISHANNGHLFNNKFDRTACNDEARLRHVLFVGTDDSEAALFPKRKLNKRKQQESAGKQWQPKRAVPRERPPAPPKLIIDERVDFPRGQRAGETPTKKKKKSKKNNQASSVDLKDESRFRTAPGKSKKDKYDKSAQMYPTDENLFNIKQRKRKR